MNISLLQDENGRAKARQKLNDIISLSSPRAANNIDRNFDQICKNIIDIADGLNAYRIDIGSESDITGNLSVNHLNGGQGAGPTTFWRGDGSWAVPPTDDRLKRIDWMQVRASGTNIDYPGANAPTTTGSPTNVTDDNYAWVQVQSGAAAGQSAGFTATVTFRGEHLPTFFARIKTGSSIAALRIWIGLTSSAIGAMDVDTVPAGSGLLMFRYSTVAADGGWVGVVGDNGTQTVSATIATIAASTTYKLKIQMMSQTECQFSIDDGTPVSITSNFPNDRAMNMLVAVITREAVAKQIIMQRAHVEGN